MGDLNVPVTLDTLVMDLFAAITMSVWPVCPNAICQMASASILSDHTHVAASQDFTAMARRVLMLMSVFSIPT